MFSIAFMCAIIIDIVALNYIGDARRFAIHPFLEHLKSASSDDILWSD